jgi:hypothetical protein
MVSWEALITEGDGASSTVKQRIGTHVCTNEDWKKFHEPADRDKVKIERLQPLNVMYCLDPKDSEGKPINKSLFGPDDDHKNRKLEINFKTCSPK